MSFKYSYMPRREYKELVSLDQYGMESDKKTIIFRNQYGEIYMFAPYKFIFGAYCICVAFGFVIGKII